MTHLRTAPTAFSRFPLSALVAGVAVLAAACGSSTTASQPSNSASANAAATTPAAAPKGSGKDHVAGMIASVNGTTVSVNTGNGTATVDFSQSTKISQVVSASPADLTVGSCVTVRPARGASSAPGAPVTAAAVALSAPLKGQCFSAAKQSGPSPAATPSAGTAPARGLWGTLTSTTGTTLVITTAPGNGSTATTVDVDNATAYTKRVPAQAQAITQGECITANGTGDASGTLQATTIGLRPANNGKCPQGSH